MKSHRWIPILLLSVFVLACSCLPASLLPAGGGTPALSQNVTSTGSGDQQGDASQYENFSQFAGTWTGTWSNATYGSTGGVEATIDVRTDGTASLAFTMTGNVLGVGFSPEIDVPGTYDSYTLVFQAIDLPAFGSLWISLDKAGSVSMRANALPVEGIGSVSAQGRMTGDTMDILYQVYLSNNQMAAGTASLTHVPSYP